MNKKILEQLRLGFEVEGVFVNTIEASLNTPGDFVHDGSVSLGELVAEHDLSNIGGLQHIPQGKPTDRCGCVYSSNGSLESYCVRHRARYHDEGNVASEFASGIYETLPSLVEDLGKFVEKKTHFWNNKCGLHIHMSLRDQVSSKLWSPLSNFNFLKKLEADAKTWCACQAVRLTRKSRYYQQFESSRHLVNDTQNHEKYRFLHFHNRLQTAEFRFLVPCKHKVDNVMRLLDAVTEHLGATENYARTGQADIPDQKRDLKINKRIKKLGNDTLQIGRRLFKSTPFNWTLRKVKEHFEFYMEGPRENEAITLSDAQMFSGLYPSRVFKIIVRQYPLSQRAMGSDFNRVFMSLCNDVAKQEQRRNEEKQIIRPRWSSTGEPF